MNRKRRTKIFIDYAQNEAKEMSKEIEEKYDVEIIQEPKEGLAMIKVRETAKNSLFYLGEVLITETKIRIDDKVGIGVVKGHDNDLSKSLAILDAAFELNLPECKYWINIFEDCEKQGQIKLEEKRYRIAKTKVDFETMNE